MLLFMQREKTDKASELAQCALQLFSENGINKVNIDAIAKASSVTKGGFYHYYKSKKEIILAACECYYRNWSNSVHGAIEAGSSNLEKLDIAIHLSVKSCLLDRANRVFTLEILTLSLYDDQVKESWAKFYKYAHQFYTKILQSAIDAGEINPPVRERGVKYRVDSMLRTMEGVKQEAHFDESLRNNQNENLICADLIKLLTR